MSDVSQGEGWWIASDGKWYPPHLHPEARTSTPPTNSSLADRLAMKARSEDGHVGPRFPDLFEKAVQGSSLADSVTWQNDGDAPRR